MIEVVKNQAKEYNALLSEHNVLMKVHAKTVNDFADKSIAYGNLKRENKDLRELVIRWEKENKILQESLDNCERDLMAKPMIHNPYEGD